MGTACRKTAFFVFAICLAHASVCSGQEPTPVAGEVKVWLSSWSNETQTVGIRRISLKHESYSMSEHGAPGNIRFLSDKGEDWLPEKILGSGLYTAAYFACATRGKPWFASSWHLKDDPAAEWSDHEASLVLALIASAEGELLPEDVLILGRVNPDRTLRNVDHIKERITAGLQQGIRKFVLPVSQTVIGEEEAMINLASWIESQGAECHRVKMLSDLTRLFLNSSREEKGSTENPENSSEADATLNRTFSGLLRKSKALLALPLDVPAWLKAHTQEMETCRAVGEEHYRLGILAYQAGLTYPACEQLRKSEARLSALAALSKLNQEPDIPLYESKAENLLTNIRELAKIQPDSGMTSGKALYFLETGDELAGLKDWVEGTTNAIRKMKPAQNTVEEAERTGAILRWVYAIESVSRELKNLSPSEQALFGSVEGANVFEAEWRVAGYLDLISLAYADMTESFFFRIPSQSDQASLKNLIHNASFVATLRNAREKQMENMTWYSGLPKDLIERRERNLIESGFVPGTGFARQDSTTVETPSPKNEAGNKLISLLNQYSRSVETAYQMKTSNDVHQGASTREGTVQGDLLRLQEIAEEQARRSIARLKEMHIDSNVPSIIFYRAFVLSQSHREEMKIEALRQFWRCTLISDALSVLSFTPTARVAEPSDNPPEALSYRRTESE